MCGCIEEGMRRRMDAEFNRGRLLTTDLMFVLVHIRVSLPIFLSSEYVMTKRRSELSNLTVQQYPSTEEYNLTRTKHLRKIYLFRFPRSTAMDLVHTCLFVHNPFVFHTAYGTKLHHVIFSMSISGSL